DDVAPPQALVVRFAVPPTELRTGVVDQRRPGLLDDILELAVFADVRAHVPGIEVMAAVGHPHVMALAAKCRDELAAEHAGAAGDENRGHDKSLTRNVLDAVEKMDIDGDIDLGVSPDVLHRVRAADHLEPQGLELGLLPAAAMGLKLVAAV